METGGTYPMLYAFFEEGGGLRREAFSRQLSAAIMSVPGDELHELGQTKRRRAVFPSDTAGLGPLQA